MTNECVRQIDGLGRVVIPKEIRKQLSLQDGDALDITQFGKLIMMQPKKEMDLQSLFQSLLTAYYSLFNIAVIVCDDRKLVATKGLSMELSEAQMENIFRIMKPLIDERIEIVAHTEGEFIALTANMDLLAAAIIPCTILGGKAGGIALITNGDSLSSLQLECSRFLAEVVSTQLSLVMSA